MEKRLKVVLLLSLLSPFFGEVMSASTPPLEIINPTAFLFLWGFYGGGVLVIRELWVRWGGGRFRLLLLGVAYGIIEEGIVLRSFFDPSWPDLEKLAIYGRCCGVNFVWVVALCIFHSIYSMGVPILIIHSLYPEYRNKRLLSNKGFRNVMIIFIFTLGVAFVGLSKYIPPAIPYILTIIVVVLLFYCARKLKNDFPPQIDFSRKHPFIISSLLAFVIIFNNLIFPNNLYFGRLHPAIPCVLGAILLPLIFSQIVLEDGEKTLLYVLGMISPFALFYDVVVEFMGYTGMAFVGIGTFVLLVWIWRSRFRNRDSKTVKS